MNQATVDTSPSTINILWFTVSGGVYSTSGDTYMVVKFMVNVKLMENSVNSHVGSVIVAKVISQYSRLGMV